jgi:adenosylmethionine-8-amino-7-oxononanoate aminotransferase
MGEYLVERLEELKELGVIGEIRGKGLMIGIEFVQNTETLEPFPKEVDFGMRVGRNCMHRQKMIVRMSSKWVAVAPPYIIEPAEIDDMVSRLGQAIMDVLGELKQ